jgi:hypothetical protein
MALRTIVLAVFLAALAAGSRAQTRVYKIELVSGGLIWSDDPPLQSGEQILFHGHPAGSLKSMRRTDIKRIVAVTAAAPASAAIRPGEAVDIGVTGPGRGRTASGPAVASGRAAGGSAALRPGEGKGGTALFNPDRTYRPDWDSKLVPGATMPFPNSPNDYKEGATLARPAGTAVQSAPGEVPKAPN